MGDVIALFTSYTCGLTTLIVDHIHRADWAGDEGRDPLYRIRKYIAPSYTPGGHWIADRAERNRNVITRIGRPAKETK